LPPDGRFASLGGIVLHRAIVSGIVIFWAIMTWELARMQLFPGKSGQMAVPVEHVIHLMFIHEQAAPFARRRRRRGSAGHAQWQRVDRGERDGSQRAASQLPVDHELRRS
jgi:hypothetical protein